MKFYAEIKTLTVKEFFQKAAQIAQLVHTNGHRAGLVGKIALSFPDFALTGRPGTTIRIHADSESDLSLLFNTQVPVLKAPEGAKLASFRNVDVKSLEKIRRRAERRGADTGCENYLKKDLSDTFFLPMYSASSGRQFSLRVRASYGDNRDGSFNSYGLSIGGKVPVF